LLSALVADALAGGVEGLDEQGAVLGGEPGLQEQRAVVVPVVADVLVLVLAVCLGGGDALVHAQRAVELRRGQAAANPEQPRLAGGGGDARQRAHLRSEERRVGE